MYGEILSAKIDILLNAPPVRLPKKPRLMLSKKLLVNSLFIAGAGSKVPSLTMISAMKVYKSFSLIYFKSISECFKH